LQECLRLGAAREAGTEVVLAVVQRHEVVHRQEEVVDVDCPRAILFNGRRGSGAIPFTTARTAP
jgi:hypothetical protein